MRAYYLVKQHMIVNAKTIIADEKNNLLYQLTTDGIKHSWSLKTYEKGYTLIVFEHGFTQSCIRFKYLNHIYTVKKSAWTAKYLVSCSTIQDCTYTYKNGSYKSHFYINDEEQSYYDEDSSIIATNEKDTVFLLLVHLAVYIIMHRT